MRLFAAQRYAVRRAAAMVSDRPLAFVLAVALVGTALALPLALASIGWSLSPLLARAQPAPEISVFIATRATPRDVDALKNRLGGAPHVVTVAVRPKDEALAQLAKQAGFGGTPGELGANPLPDVLIAQLSAATPEAIDRLTAEVRGWPLVDAVRSDLDWYRKVRAFGRVLTVTTLAFGTMMALMTTLVLLGTVRLHASTRADEIAVLTIAGATPRFMVRPYAYSAALTCGLAALAAAFAVFACHAALRKPLAELSSLYGSSFALPDPDSLHAALAVLVAVAFGWLIGWFGARLALAQQATRW